MQYFFMFAIKLVLKYFAKYKKKHREMVLEIDIFRKLHYYKLQFQVVTFSKINPELNIL
jgi:hypothetical protein